MFALQTKIECWLIHVFRLLQAVAKRRVLSCIVAGLLPMLVRLAVLPLAGYPYPSVHDEYAHLLGADTFASGRLTNPAHPMWVHFETIHVNPIPTYTSKYPPAQAAFMALGQIVFGHPWYGVWLSYGVMCAALCWMMQGWMPPLYAFVGTLLAMGQVSIFGPWMNSYWGGAVTAVGGCMLLGSLPRLVRRITVANSTIAGLGLMVLAFSRPFEGLITAVAAGLGFVWWRQRLGKPFSELLSYRLFLPMTFICGVGFLMMGYYNYRTTGNPLMMPYMVNEAMYAPSPLFSIFPSRDVTPVYRHEVIRQYWMNWVGPNYGQLRSNPLRAFYTIFMMVRFYYSALLGCGFLAAALFARNIKVTIAVVMTSGVIAVLLVENSSLQAHYFAPAACLLLIPPMYSLRWLRVLIGHAGPIVLLLCIASVAITGAYDFPEARGAANPGKRQGLIDHLRRQPGRHLVIVRYSPTHNVHEEFVYNRADIDASPIVWAQDMGDARNCELIDYYGDRKVWLLEPDMSPIRVSEYRPSFCAGVQFEGGQ